MTRYNVCIAKNGRTIVKPDADTCRVGHVCDDEGIWEAAASSPPLGAADEISDVLR